MFSQTVLAALHPRAPRGRSSARAQTSGLPQYWQRNSSREKTLIRENFTPRFIPPIGRLSLTTAGALMVRVRRGRSPRRTLR